MYILSLLQFIAYMDFQLPQRLHSRPFQVESQLQELKCTGKGATIGKKAAKRKNIVCSVETQDGIAVEDVKLE